MDIRTGHIVAAFVGSMLFGMLLMDPQMAAAHPGFGGQLQAVLWGSLFGGLTWECIIRLSRSLSKGLRRLRP
jgi:hypothetical protein